jgi:hypothetical protein
MSKLAKLGAMLPGLGIITVACDQATTAPDHISSPNFAVLANDEIATPFSVFVPCANGGAGEFVFSSDLTLHVLVSLTTDAAGGFHIASHLQPMGGNGVGVVTGDKYQATGGSRDGRSFNSGGLPFVETFVDNFRWIGPGPGNNLFVHATYHVTTNENDVSTAFVDNTSVECR